jgi:frataxin-like iron-binding protein CyaY
MAVIPFQVRHSLLWQVLTDLRADVSSGPKRYDYSPTLDDWHYSRERRTMGDLLNDELSQALQQKVELGVREISKQLS